MGANASCWYIAIGVKILVMITSLQNTETLLCWVLKVSYVDGIKTFENDQAAKH